MLFRRFVIICLLFSIIFIIACDNINETYEKKFDIYSMYRDLTIIENGKVLRQEDVELLKNYIDRKILSDSLRWLKRYTYHDLFVYAAKSANSLSFGTPDESRWKINNMLTIKMVDFSPEDGQISFSIQNNSGKNIKSFRAEVKFFTLSDTKIGQIDINYKDNKESASSDRRAFHLQMIYLLIIILLVKFPTLTKYKPQGKSSTGMVVEAMKAGIFTSLTFCTALYI